MTNRAIALIALMAAVAVGAPAACGGSSPTRLGGSSAGGGGGDDTDGVVVGAGVGTTTSAGGGNCANGCNDGLPCTVDACNAGACEHTPMTCPEGQTCDVVMGCVPAMACTSTAQCQAALGSDACKSDILCDPAQSICTYKTLDKDADGYPPVVCGGTDCNDDDPTIHPGALEICDGKDNDCNGLVDDGATCPGGTTCMAGACSCPAADMCNGVCVDLTSDHDHCGSCLNACAQAATCTGSMCVCSANATNCNGQCVDLTSDPQNCGVCNKECAIGATCQGSTCVCIPGSQVCSGECIDTTSDPNNCGACNKICPAGASCEASNCVCGGSLELCSGTCVNVLSDPNNCDVCGHVCPGGEACVNGACQVQSLYFPLGPQTNVSTGSLTGWKLCYQDTYAVVMANVISTIQAECSEAHILMACAPNGAASYTLLAAGLRTDVFFETGAANNNTTHVANGVGWYFDAAWSWGFVPAADTPTKFECDTNTTPDDALRLCWHTYATYGGYRCGSTLSLNTDATTSRYVFEAP